MSPPNGASAHRDAVIARTVLHWFHAHARDLPWRTPTRDPYHTLVSETMLQQTQVARVVEKFAAFIGAFPTVRHLARAGEQDVQRLWSGLGYHRRARLLRAAAQRIVELHDGALPSDLDALRALPGVGRYTAGAIASLAFAVPTPAVDGNVARVLMRLDARRGDVAAGAPWAWSRAEALLARAPKRAAALNEGLIELGALVCTPAAPKCDACPLARHCQARAQGAPARIPAPRRRAPRRAVHHAVVVVTDARGLLALERRASEGLWADLWQAPTVEADDSMPCPRAVRTALASRGLRLGPFRRREEFTRVTSHRDVRFRVWSARLLERAPRAPGRRWITPSALDRHPLATPHRLILIPDSAAASRAGSSRKIRGSGAITRLASRPK